VLEKEIADLENMEVLLGSIATIMENVNIKE